MPNGQLKKAIKKIKGEVQKGKLKVKPLDAETKTLMKVPTNKAPMDVVSEGLASLAHGFAVDAPPEVMAPAWGQLKQIEETVKQFAESARLRVLDYVKEHGQQVEGGSSIEAQIAGLILRITPTKTGFDGKKVEALLRRKNADLQRYMDAVTSYKLSNSKLTDALNNGVVTQEEVEACRYDEPGYNVYKPKLVGEE